jgi:hypothetical protein
VPDTCREALIVVTPLDEESFLETTIDPASMGIVGDGDVPVSFPFPDSPSPPMKDR